jgi:probable phosphoglycerate mutase
MRSLPADLGLVTELIVWCDGAARGNPGPAGAGAMVTTTDGSVVAEVARGLGVTTNNVAEYTAAILGLERADELGATSVVLRSDSLLMVNQLTGRWKVKTAHLKPLHARVLQLTARLQGIRFEHVPRGENEEADRLANLGADDWRSGSASPP